MMARTGLTEQEWQAIERIDGLDAMCIELAGLSQERWRNAVQALREQVQALPTRRAMAKEDTQAK